MAPSTALSLLTQLGNRHVGPTERAPGALEDLCQANAWLIELAIDHWVVVDSRTNATLAYAPVEGLTAL